MKIFIISILLFFLSNVNASDGMINVESKYNVSTTAERLLEILSKRGMTIFNRIKHSEDAVKFGVQLRETELIIFGNPMVGSPLMKCQQKIAIDLPQKIMIWEDGNNQVWVSYNDVNYLKNRHDVQGCEKTLSKITKALENITRLVSNK